MSVVLDAGAFVALERGDRRLLALIRRERREGRVPLTHAGVIGQVWRGGRGRQAGLAKVMRGIAVRAIDDDLGRRAGVLLGRSGRSDVIDAALALIAEDGDEVYTGDAADLREIVAISGRTCDLIEI